jgi:hypothetical protein
MVRELNFRPIRSHGGSKLPHSQGAFGAINKNYAALGKTPAVPAKALVTCFLVAADLFA